MKTEQKWKIGDCLQLLQGIPDKSVDMILTDLPYGTTQNRWDAIIPPEELWLQYERIITNNGVILLFGHDKFTAKMMLSNQKIHRYNLIWDKELVTGFLNANRMPLRQHEDIMVFYKESPVYNPQKICGVKNHSVGKMLKGKKSDCYGEYVKVDNSEVLGNTKYPTSILQFPKPHASICRHEAEKPLTLFEYLIKTYTNEGDTVHDSCLGSGTTLEACMNLNRNCIGFEIDPQWGPIYRKRLRLDNTKLDAFNTSRSPHAASLCAVPLVRK